MTDREKVIKAIEICYFGKHNCTECELFYVEDCNDKLMRNVLELLKPVKPMRLNHTENYQTDNYRCGVCGEYMYYEQHFCETCGTEAKWNA